MEKSTIIIVTADNPHETQEIVHRIIYEQLKDEQASGAIDYTHRVLGLHPESYKITAPRITEPSLDQIAYLDVPPTVLEDSMAIRLRPTVLAIYDFTNFYPEEEQATVIDHIISLTKTGHDIIIGTTSEAVIRTIQEASRRQNIKTQTVSA